MAEPKIGVVTEQEIPWDPNSAFTFKTLSEDTKKEDEDKND